MSGILIHAATPLPPGPQAWAYAVGAPYNVAHGLSVDAVVADRAGDFQQEMLTRDWDINSRDDLIAQLNLLGSEGHRRHHGIMLRHYATLWRPQREAWRDHCYAAIKQGGVGAQDAAATLWRLNAVEANTSGIRSSPLLAFDAARAVMLTRAGLMLGWLAPDEAWPYLETMAYDVQRNYTSWAAYGADFRLSRSVWSGDSSEDSYADVIALLLATPDSPWRQLPWALPLRGGQPTPARDGEGPLWSLEAW